MNFTIKELNELIYSLGTTATKGKLCDKELNASLLDKICEELTRKFTNEEADEEVESSTYYVSNEEADEDASLHMLTSFPIINPFTSVSEDYDNHLTKLKERGYITQSILDFVLNQGDATYTEMQNFYRKLTGSNSFSHHLYNLTTPYKNRPTRRYLVKNANGNYEVKIANTFNWVAIEDDVMVHRY
jgi:hypothetical protein